MPFASEPRVLRLPKQLESNSRAESPTENKMKISVLPQFLSERRDFCRRGGEGKKENMVMLNVLWCHTADLRNAPVKISSRQAKAAEPPTSP